LRKRRNLKPQNIGFDVCAATRAVPGRKHRFGKACIRTVVTKTETKDGKNAARERFSQSKSEPSCENAVANHSVGFICSREGKNTMNKIPASTRIEEKRVPRALPFDGVPLVFQGGGALGAYQAGVYQAIDEANIEVSWICGTSIGAINGALIVGNPPEQRVEKLREFWEAITKPQIAFPNIPWLPDLSLSENPLTRYWINKISTLATMMQGVPGFFSARPFPPVNSPAESPSLVSYYDISPLKTTLGKLVDFDLINSKSMRLSVGAANVQTGASTYFNNDERPISMLHILASASLPPGFPPTEINGEYYWDGAVVSNTPMQHVIDTRQRDSALIFQVDLWDPNGEVPLDIPSAFLRATEIHSASRANISLEQYKKMEKFRNALCSFFDRLPKQYQNDPDARFLENEARVKAATIVHLKYQPRKYEGSDKTFEFSRGAMEEHWKTGYEDTKVALAEPAVLEPPSVAEALRIFDVRQGWMK
jgi:NTE family protein